MGEDLLPIDNRSAALLMSPLARSRATRAFDSLNPIAIRSITDSLFDEELPDIFLNSLAALIGPEDE